jgi:hypothetical protein
MRKHGGGLVLLSDIARSGDTGEPGGHVTPAASPGALTAQASVLSEYVFRLLGRSRWRRCWCHAAALSVACASRSFFPMTRRCKLTNGTTETSTNMPGLNSRLSK